MKALKNWWKKRAAPRMLGGLIASYIWLCYRTSRVEWRNADALLAKAMAQRDTPNNYQPVLIAFWHGRLALMPKISPTRHHSAVMISRHGDGAIIASACRYFRLKIIRGSTNRPKDDPKGAKDRGGGQALREALQALENSINLVITPDGPRGPMQKVQDGVIELARLAQCPIFPVSCSTRRAITINSWDRFLLPLPFSRICYVVGEPITLAANADKATREKTRKVLENALNALTDVADSEVGRRPTEGDEAS